MTRTSMKTKVEIKIKNLKAVLLPPRLLKQLHSAKFIIVPIVKTKTCTNKIANFSLSASEVQPSKCPEVKIK